MTNEKILIRCDAAEIYEIGTGHLARCITICKYLIYKHKFKKTNFIFLLKTKKKYRISEEILKSEGFDYISLENKIVDCSYEELEIIKRINPKVIIIDRLQPIKEKFLFLLEKANIKSVLIDDKSNFRINSDLYLNPLIFKKKKKFKNQGFNYSIFPSIIYKIKKKNKKTKNNKIKLFLFFGGYDPGNIQRKLIKILNNYKNYKLVISEKYKLSFKKENYSYYNKKNFYKKMEDSDIAIISGGLILFDAINFNLPIICIPQYLHQKRNALNLKKSGLIYFLELKKNTEIKLIKLLYKLTRNSLIINKLISNQKKFLIKLKYKKILKDIKDLYENK
jgi:spore coat polysaccharide biosynthesis predicted glycosyltransferase SpsG